jgi:hypothetical protein
MVTGDLTLTRERKSYRRSEVRSPEGEDAGRLLGEPNVRREARSPDGFHRQYLSKPAGKYPGCIVSRENAPFAMPEEIAEAVAALKRDLQAKGVNPGDLPQGLKVKAKGILDEALTDWERAALAAHIWDRIITGSGVKIADYGQPRGSIASEARTKLAFSRLQFISSAFPPSYEEHLDALVEHMTGSTGIEMTSPKDIGKLLVKSSDERVGKGGYIGAMIMIARWVHSRHIAFDIERSRRNRGLSSHPASISRPVLAMPQHAAA